MGMILQSAAGIAALVCWILIIVKLFQAKQTVLGIISIVLCGLGGYICGWIKAKELGLQKIMLIWTVAIILSIVGAFLPGGSVAMTKQAIEESQSTLPEASPGTQ